MKLKNVMTGMLAFSISNMWTRIVICAFERSIASGILSTICGVMYIIASGYFVTNYKAD